MTMTLKIPERVAQRLADMAKRRGTAPEQLAVELLTEDVEDAEDAEFPTLDEVMALIKALPPSNVAPAQGDLAEYLAQTGVDDPDFDVEAWNRKWAEVEAEMKREELEDEITEGRF